VLADWLINDPVKVPEPVTGDPEMLKTLEGNASPTLNTVSVASKQLDIPTFGVH
jgi:hypothetical protein